MQSLLKMFNFSNAPTVALSDDEVSAEADEPPDDHLASLKMPTRTRSLALQRAHRESLLTRAIMAESKHDEPSPVSTATRGLSTTSSHSTASMTSTAELTSDGDLTSPSRSATPSPPPPPGRFTGLLNGNKPSPTPSKIVIAPNCQDERPSVANVGEAAVEKSLGRKRCIMFACAGTDSEKSKDDVSVPTTNVAAETEPPKRKCMLTFACPTRTSSGEGKSQPSKLRIEQKSPRRLSPAPSRRRQSTDSNDLTGRSADTTIAASADRARVNPPSPKATFHEFGSSHDETDAWIDRPNQHKEKLTLDDCMKKENKIRQIGREAEEEAEEEEREQEEFEEELEDNEAHVDDFAPSDEESDGGNESDDEGGFASSDEESDAGSECQFWAPTRTTTRNTSIDNMQITHFSSRRHSDASSVDSEEHSGALPLFSARRPLGKYHANGHRISKMRPGTPELPDSTDFVCGTLDEDRPLEAAYISCREQRKRERHIPIPQDIDPSFPTTDPEEEEDEVDDVVHSHPSSDEPRWLTEQFGALEDIRGRRKTSIASPREPSPRHGYPARRVVHRSPPPKHMVARSPPPRRLFGHSPTRLRSPPPPARLRSPRGSPTGVKTPQLHMRGLAQRPNMERTASLPDTPNPFFKNFKVGSASISNIASGAVTPAIEEPPRADLHVRGPVDIVIGLEKKRQKRKEKFWRQHCRKVAKEQAERKPLRGRGAQRMRELGLECAERMKGYGVGQQTQLVISL
ncbi:hypothetical protein PV08_04185 [Exophiala spinifera]|uniref:Uncharacterized protein n=1 Tax=Exophiala spinifera TaxID=91928 RepID=A0A0D2C090_9EURO|nr:uncharacterized protein PV08_04185 [Exophiala spinifera]KIW16994.1 hypothetical protein PV08_04185 [Exophiala spinifera]